MSDDRINDPDREIDSTIMKLVEQYASCDRRSADINEERATIRSNAEKLGFTSQEFQDGVRRTKKMSKTERDIHERNVNRIVSIAETRQSEFWPAEAERQRKRAERRAADAAEASKGSAGAPDPDTNPRSDPKRGGAGKKKGERPTEEQLTAAASEAEQQAGEDALKGLAPETAAAQTEAKTPKSQSQIAAEKMEAAKLN